MKEIHEAIDILKGLQATDGEYDHYRETKLYEALRLLEGFVEQKPVTQAATIPETSVMGLWADEKPEPVTVNITNSGVNRNPLDKAADAIKSLGDAFKNTHAQQAIDRSQRSAKHPFSTIEHPADRHQVKKAYSPENALIEQRRRYNEDLEANRQVAREMINSGLVVPDHVVKRLQDLSDAIRSVETDLQLLSMRP